MIKHLFYRAYRRVFYTYGGFAVLVFKEVFMADKKAVTLENLGIVKNYVDEKDAKNIKSADFIDNTIKFYSTEDKSGEAVAEIVLPEETFLDVSKTEFVSNFSWSGTKYPKSVNPDLDGMSVLVLAVKAGKSVKYSFVSLDSVMCTLSGADTDSAGVSINEGTVTLDVKISGQSDNRVAVKADGLYVGIVDNTPSWTVSTDDEVRNIFMLDNIPVYGEGTLGAKNVGDILKINENGVPTNFIIVHKGNPDPEMYDASCDGIWVLREKLGVNMNFDGTSNDYENSDVYTYLNNDYLNMLDIKTNSIIKNVKIPYYKGSSMERVGVQVGNKGLGCKVFLLSLQEINNSVISDTKVPKDGSPLNFDWSNSSRKACNDIGLQADWWTRSLNLYYTDRETLQWVVKSDGSTSSVHIISGRTCIRPAFILPYNVPVDADGTVIA